MIKKSQRILAIALILMIPAGVYAQESKNSFYDPTSVKNPFRSKLPQKMISPQPEIKRNTVQNEKSQTEKEQNKTAAPVEPVAPVEKFVLPALVLSGIVWDTERPQAIINAQVVNINDVILGAKIVAISRNGVDIVFKGKTVTIKL